MKRKTRQILKELQIKMGQAGKATYQRLKLAAEVLQDTDWVAEKGSLNSAYRFIQKEYFGDLCLAISIETLLELQREFSEREWEDHNWNLQVLRAEVVERKRQEKPKGKKQTATLKEVEELKNDKSKLEVCNQQLTQTLEQEKRSRVEEADRLKVRVAELEEENTRLKCENERLKGRLEELEKIRQVA